VGLEHHSLAIALAINRVANEKKWIGRSIAIIVIVITVTCSSYQVALVALIIVIIGIIAICFVVLIIVKADLVSRTSGST
jgi:hypothetical protein